MCVIIHLLPGKSIDREKVYNAACNNWHSWGLIIKDEESKKLEVIKRFPQGAKENTGGCYNDIDEIMELLENNKDKERFLHLRWASQGEVNESNTHPFLLYKNEETGREVYFMHNGTFTGFGYSGNHEYGNYGTATNPNPLTNADDSDTKKMVDQYLAPVLSKEGFDGDYTGKIFQQFFWNKMYSDRGGNSRVIFISNDQPSLKSGKWDTWVDPDNETSYFSSNDEYFKELKRGPIFTQQREEAERRRKQEEEEKKAAAFSANSQTPLASGSTLTVYDKGTFQPNPEIIEGLVEIFKTLGVSEEGLDRSNIASLNYLTQTELLSTIDTFIVNEKYYIIAGFLEFLIQSYSDLWADYCLVEEKKKKAELLIASFKESSKTALKVVGGTDV